MASSIQGNSLSYWAVPQTSPSSGVPSNPVWQAIRRASGDVDIQKSFTQSELVSQTRQPGYNIITGSSVTGDIDSELTVADPTFELIAKSALQGDFSAVVNTTGSATFTNSSSEITLTGAFTNAAVGQYVFPFDSTLNARVFKITSITDNNTAVVSPAPVDETTSVTLKGKSIRNSNQETAFSLQKRIPTDSGTVYKTFAGCQVGTLELGLSAESIATLSYSIVGLEKVAGDTQISGATDATPSSARVLGTVQSVLEFWINDSPASTSSVCYTDFSVSLDNGSQENAAIGKEGACSISFGAANITGSLTSYVDGTDTTTAQSEVLKRDNETLFNLGVTLKDVDGNYLIVDMPTIQYTELAQSNTANGEILQNAGSYSAVGEQSGYALELTIISAP